MMGWWPNPLVRGAWATRRAGLWLRPPDSRRGRVAKTGRNRRRSAQVVDHRGRRRRPGRRRRRHLVGHPRHARAAAAGIVTTTTVQTVTTGTISQTVAATGTIEPATTANLNFAVSGKVTAVDVTPGQVVTEGQTLATVDPTALNATLAQAQATLANDQAQLATDQADGASATQIALDNANIASAQNQVTSGPDGGGRRHPGVDDGRHGGLGEPDRGPAGHRVLAPPRRRVPRRRARRGSTAAPADGLVGFRSPGSSASASASTGLHRLVLVVVLAARWWWCRPARTSSTPRCRAAACPRSRSGDQATITPSGATTPVYGTVGLDRPGGHHHRACRRSRWSIDVTGSPSGLYGGTSANVSIIVEGAPGRRGGADQAPSPTPTAPRPSPSTRTGEGRPARDHRHRRRPVRPRSSAG